MENENKIGLFAESPSENNIFNHSYFDYIIQTRKIPRSVYGISDEIMVDFILDTPSGPIFLTKTEEEIPCWNENDPDAIEAILKQLQKKGYRRFR